MDIELHLPTIAAVVRDEHAQASRDIATLGPVAAYERTCYRHDERLAAAPDRSTLACKAGCSWCCYFSVDVRAAEVFAILAFMQRELSAAAQQRIRGEIETNRSLLAGCSDEERSRRNIKCPFLDDGRCVIYTARPQSCRNYHATNATGCRRSFENPDDLDIDPEFAPLVYQSGGALSAALADPDARRRFESKQKPFAGMEGTHVELEFVEFAVLT